MQKTAWACGCDSVMALPRQMMLGAVQDPQLIYSYGKTVAEQCKRMGIQVDYAPVVDVNNNPDNPGHQRPFFRRRSAPGC